MNIWDYTCFCWLTISAKKSSKFRSQSFSCHLLFLVAMHYSSLLFNICTVRGSPLHQIDWLIYHLSLLSLCVSGITSRERSHTSQHLLNVGKSLWIYLIQTSNLNIEMYSHRQEAHEVWFRSPWSISTYPQCYGWSNYIVNDTYSVDRFNLKYLSKHWSDSHRVFGIEFRTKKNWDLWFFALVTFSWPSHLIPRLCLIPLAKGSWNLWSIPHIFEIMPTLP